MDIKDFIKESLIQIVDGITETNKVLETRGASIPTTGVAGEGVWWKLIKDSKNSQTKHAMRVDFDLAITASQSDNLKAGGEISIASLINAKTSAENISQSESISRIKYTIPLELPNLIQQ